MPTEKIEVVFQFLAGCTKTHSLEPSCFQNNLLQQYFHFLLSVGCDLFTYNICQLWLLQLWLLQLWLLLPR